VRSVALVATTTGPRDAVNVLGKWYTDLWGARRIRVEAEGKDAIVAEVRKEDLDAVATSFAHKPLVERLLFEETGDDFRTTSLLGPE